MDSNQERKKVNWYENREYPRSDDRPGKWDEYAFGYLEAARRLSSIYISGDINSKQLGLPSIYLYRHYLELRLKEIMERGALLVGEEHKNPNTHDLSQLWEKVKPIIKEIWSDSPDSSLSDIRDTLKEISEIDLKSDSFRYPIDSKGAPTLLYVQHIELEDLLTQLNPVIDNLEAMSDGIAVMINNLDDTRSMNY